MLKRTTIVTTSLVVFLFVAFVSGCTREPELDGYPEVSFLNEVKPIISANCTQAGCHTGSRGEFPLVSYEDIAGAVTPFNARKSELYKAITGRSERMMPPGGPMADDQIRNIFVWIEQGAKNN
jgi:hypothetical protein